MDPAGEAAPMSPGGGADPRGAGSRRRSGSSGGSSPNDSGRVSEFTTPDVTMHYELVDLP